VYRSPMEIACTNRGISTWWSSPGNPPSPRKDRISKGIRDSVLGVSAYEVCHGKYADPKNVPTFFDGSKIAASNSSPAFADALHGYYQYDGNGGIKSGGTPRKPQEAIVAIDGFWPISGNYGAFPDPTGAAGGDPDPNPDPVLGSGGLMYPKPLIDKWVS